MTGDRSLGELERGSSTVTGHEGGQERSTERRTLAKYAFFEGRIVPFEEARIHILTHAFNYGTAVFEGIRGYLSESGGQINIVRLVEHLERLAASCRIMMLEPGYTAQELRDIVIELVQKNAFRCDIYVRPIAYCCALRVGPGMNEEQSVAIYTIPMMHYLDPSRAIDVMVSSWRRTDDNAIPARGKISGAYVNSALAITDARRAGFDDAILLNQDGHVSEGAVMNIFILRKGVLATPRGTDNILEGITRADVTMLAREELGLPVVERPIDRTELYQADEIFFCGTGAKILGVGSVDRRKIGGGAIGPVTRKLQQMYDSIVRGANAKYSGWLTPV